MQGTAQGSTFMLQSYLDGFDTEPLGILPCMKFLQRKPTITAHCIILDVAMSA